MDWSEGLVAYHTSPSGTSKYDEAVDWSVGLVVGGGGVVLTLPVLQLDAADH